MDSPLTSKQLDAVYRDMQARIEMGLLTNDEQELDGALLRTHLLEAIKEKAFKDSEPEKSVDLDHFSIAFGIITERIIREVCTKHGMEWW